MTIVAGTKQVWIYCHVPNGNPEIVSYRWTKSNSLLSTVLSSAQMYVIESAVEKDTGKYTCTAYNSAVNSSGTVDIYNVRLMNMPHITIIYNIGSGNVFYAAMLFLCLENKRPKSIFV